jgi:uncharacterized protein
MADAPLTPPSPQPALQNFFRSPGLPSGFVRVLIYLILVEGTGYVLKSIVRGLVPRGLVANSPQLLMTGESLALAGTLIPAWLMSLLEKRHVGEYGLPLRGALGRLFWQGALFGLIEISTVVGALGALGYYHFGGVELNESALLRWVLFWGIFFLVVGLYEEFTFRGYVQFTLAQGMGFWPAGILLSVLFGAIHWTNPGETPAGIAGIVLTGLFWCLTLQRTGNLWFAVGMHASFDFGETFLYSVPDSGVVFPGHLSSATLAGPTWLSGGTAGPEASIFDFLVILALFYIFHLLHPAAPQAKSTRQASEPSVDQI